MGDSEHEELFFSDYRDYWYNKDFLDLMARRWGLSQYSSLLDIGCGMCHWSKLLVPYLKPQSKVTAYDNEVIWAAGSNALKRKFASLNSKIEFVKGDAQRLPFADNSFDVVTCQTVLIHVENPVLALAEMKRVVKKGGIVICAEPNNLAGTLIKDTVTKNDTLHEKLEQVKFSALWERGKIALKQGDNSFGDLLTGAMNEVGFVNLQSYISDKAIPLYPPYSNAEQQATIESMRLWDAETKRLDNIGRKYFEALGDDATDFYDHFSKKGNGVNSFKQIEQNEYCSAGVAIMYLVSGTK